MTVLTPAASAQVTLTRESPARIVLAGDSTVTDEVGWGPGFAQSWNDKVEVINISRGGRSSKSFRDEGHWQKALDAKPDFVLIQFGHNDQPGKGPKRETDPATTYRENLKRYIADVRDMGATPVLVTPLARRRWTEDGALRGTGLDAYAEAVRAVGEEENVPVLDLYTKSIAMYRSLGEKATHELSPEQGNGSYDGTHLNDWGGKLVGNMVADMFRREFPAFNDAWTWRRLEFPDPRAGKSRDRAVTAGEAGPLTAQGERTLTVNPDGTGDFRTIQEALDAVPANNSDRTILDIQPGVYQGPIIVGADKPNVTFRGHGPEQTVLTYALNVKAPLSDSQGFDFNGVGVTVLGDDFIAEDLTFENTSGDYGQAMAVRVQGDRAIFRRCNFLGWQDTLLVHSNRQFFEDCYIEGRVDFIYGSSTAVFYHCEIHSKNGGWVTASNSPQEQPFGMVFIACRLTSDDATPTYLGRPWRPYAAVAFINCYMGEHIRPEAWHNWGDPEKEKTARYSEYHSTGPGANPEARVPWSRQLSEEEAKRYTIPNVLAGNDHWNPQKP